MTRVAVLLVCALAVSAAVSKTSDPFLAAERMLAEYSSQSTNLTSILGLLEESANQNNPEAYLRLGEFHLFGLPLSPDNPDYVSYDYRLKRDFSKAVKYFRKAKHLGAKDASFYLEFLLHQSLIVREFENSVPMASDYLYSHQSLQNEGLKQQSQLTMLSYVSGYRQCQSAENWASPAFLTENVTTVFHAFPYFDEDAQCRRTCNAAVKYAQQVANSSMELYQRLGYFPSYDIGPLHNVLDQMHSQSGSKTLALLHSHADIGDKEAVAVLAETYYRGNTALAVSANLTLAVTFYERAAEDGDVAAMEKLGALYSKGVGVDKDPKRALHFLQKAADLGSVTAHTGLGHLYLAGEGVPKDTKAAFEHFRYAADHGNVESQSYLSSLYFSGEHTKKDPKLGLDYLLKAVQQGYYPALYRLAQMMNDGTFVVRSCDNAVNLFWLVGQNGAIGKFLRWGYHFVKEGDYEGAYLSFAVAAAIGYESAQLSAAYMWEKGMVPYTCKYGNEFCAASYYTMSALLTNNSWAKFRLGDISYYGSEYFAPDQSAAFSLYSSSQSLPEARFSLAYMYEHGLGIVQNVSTAKQLYEDLVVDATKGTVATEVRYPAYLALARLQAAEYFTQGLEWVESLVPDTLPFL